MHTEPHVRLFRNVKNQALRIPREFELDALEAIIRREGACLVIEPVRKKGLLATLAGLSEMEEEFPDVDVGMLPIESVDL